MEPVGGRFLSVLGEIPWRCDWGLEEVWGIDESICQIRGISVISFVKYVYRFGKLIRNNSLSPSLFLSFFFSSFHFCFLLSLLSAFIFHDVFI